MVSGKMMLKSVHQKGVLSSKLFIVKWNVFCYLTKLYFFWACLLHSQVAKYSAGSVLCLLSIEHYVCYLKTQQPLLLVPSLILFLLRPTFFDVLFLECNSFPQIWTFHVNLHLQAKLSCWPMRRNCESRWMLRMNILQVITQYILSVTADPLFRISRVKLAYYE